MQPGEYLAASNAPVKHIGQFTRVVTLPSADPPQKVSFKGLLGVWLAWCPSGNPQYDIYLRFATESGAAPAAGEMDALAAGGAGPFSARQSDRPFLIDVDNADWTDIYIRWTGAAPTTLVLTRVYPPGR